jgi:hypothetical protein
MAFSSLMRSYEEPEEARGLMLLRSRYCLATQETQRVRRTRRKRKLEKKEREGEKGDRIRFKKGLRRRRRANFTYMHVFQNSLSSPSNIRLGCSRIVLTTPATSATVYITQYSHVCPSLSP